ncbi:hypothetical protein DPMN_094324 [Dreissena polymorpha]|uniref:Uncharacterized protein n=1 Tax=Dreissena polymorpha TaxID=45954 RepID=A0A9D4R2S0_DREPO|nr:hypothetical protein DPMN_094324 [Dreissena polymorpha]
MCYTYYSKHIKWCQTDCNPMKINIDRNIYRENNEASTDRQRERVNKTKINDKTERIDIYINKHVSGRYTGERTGGHRSSERAGDHSGLLTDRPTYRRPNRRLDKAYKLTDIPNYMLADGQTNEWPDRQHTLYSYL